MAVNRVLRRGPKPSLKMLWCSNDAGIGAFTPSQRCRRGHPQTTTRCYGSRGPIESLSESRHWFICRRDGFIEV
jgi:hypothetical protein